jgi:hypothetical protein
MLKPPSFKVIGQRFRIGWFEDGDPLEGIRLEPEVVEAGVAGVTVRHKQRILINKEMAPHQQLDTYLHEALHAMFYMTGLSRAGGPLATELHEEEVIVSLAPVLLQFIRDNPAVMNYLRQRVP